MSGKLEMILQIINITICSIRDSENRGKRYEICLNQHGSMNYVIKIGVLNQKYNVALSHQ